MRDHFVKFIEEDVDGCGTNVTVIARVCGNDITVGTIDRVKDAICHYKNENEDEWDTDGCLKAAKEQLETEGYEVYWINTEIKIYF